MYTMTTERFNFITRDEFNAREYRNDHKFDDLTNIMLAEFDKVHGKTSQIDTRLDSIEIRLTNLTEDSKELKLGMKSANSKIDKIFDRLDEHDKKFDLIDKKLEIMDSKFDRIFNKLDEHDGLFNIINTKLDAILIK